MSEWEPAKIRIEFQQDWIVIRQNDMCIVVKTKEQAKEIAHRLDDAFGDATCITCGNYP